MLAWPVAGQLVGSIGGDESLTTQFAIVADLLKKVGAGQAASACFSHCCHSNGSWPVAGRSDWLHWANCNWYDTVQCASTSSPCASHPHFCPPQWEYKAEEVGKAQHAFTVRVRHKYGASMEVGGEAAFAGTASMRTM